MLSGLGSGVWYLPIKQDHLFSFKSDLFSKKKKIAEGLDHLTESVLRHNKIMLDSDAANSAILNFLILKMFL